MKVITEERFRMWLSEVNDSDVESNWAIIDSLIDEFQEIDTLTPKETDLILAAEKYAEAYFDDDRQFIKTDVINAFMCGAEWGKRNK